ncbi:hypothetical protein [Cohnella mopanensis]|uniref:hypothetical protein n=1 Tax=Cohnella mopanensis TaxID=2911966 RepID=UPI001EF8A156|nr:hypothetical protein [Cohnella mopanensis]
MKKVSTSFVFFTIILACLVGCNKAASVINEVNIEGLNKNAKIFVDNIKNSNGLYLFSPIDEKQYLIVSYSNVLQGEEAKFLSSINAEVQDQTLTINLEELVTQDYQDKRLKKLTIFNLGSDQEYEKIRIFKNGEETHFDLVGG